ncbi:MAG: HAD hydrolase family protein [Bacteroidota bacterium]|nr:HAD hydrolase family protein [Bacteroidota bacterium]
MNYFKRNIKYLKKKHNISINKIAETAKKEIIYIEQCERGITAPDADTLIAFSTIFNISIDKLIKTNISESENLIKNKDIKLLVCDIDGVLTDGGMYYTENGDEMKKFNTKDGMALLNIKEKGIKTALLSSGFKANIGTNRAKTLKTDFVYIGRDAKLGILKKWCKELDIELSNVAYLGDDVNDLEIIKEVGISACPANAILEVKNSVNIILYRNGGDACVREFVDGYF